MEARLVRLAEGYRASYRLGENVWEELRGLYEKLVKEREQTLLDAAAASAGLGSLFADQIDLAQVTPQMREAFEAAYPKVGLESLADRGPEALTGFLGGWKGKYFEVLVRDQLNAGEQVGEISLDAGQQAVLADSPIQPGWDLQILNADGTVDKVLQLKATDYLSRVKDALERYPDIDVLTTVEAADDVPNQILSSGMSDAELEEAIRGPMEPLLDSTLEEVAEAVLPGLPFVIIALSEGRKVMTGRKTLELAFRDSSRRAVKSGASMAVGAGVYVLGGGLLSIPATALSRIVMDVSVNRYKRAVSVAKALESRIDSVRRLGASYSQ